MELKVIDGGKSVRIACTTADIDAVLAAAGVPLDPQPAFTRSGQCAHPKPDLLDCCRYCGVQMTDEEMSFRQLAWEEQYA